MTSTHDAQTPSEDVAARDGSPRGADLRRTALLLTLLWALAMISIPLLRWFVGDGALAAGVWPTVLLHSAATVTALAALWGISSALRTAALLVLCGWCVELLGSRTGLPFGPYSYTNTLQPQLLGVPLLVPFAWLMMLPTAWAVSEQIAGRNRNLLFALTAALAFTVWDLFLDPQMVAWGFWEWASPGGYFGIPWINFAGWVLCAFALTLVLRPGPLPQPRARPLLILYTVTWILQAIGMGLFWGLPGPAVVGFVAMGSFVLVGWFAPGSSRAHESTNGPCAVESTTRNHAA